MQILIFLVLFVQVNFSGLYFSSLYKKMCCQCVLAGIFLYSAESFL